MPMAHQFNIVIEQDRHGFYAYCPELEGCQSEGDTFEDAMGNIREAIALYMETLTRNERRALVRKQVYTTTVEVKVA